MKEAFEYKKFRDATLAVIVQADEIISEYQRRGFQLTLRQLYYQFVARDLIPNKQSEYKRLGSIVNDARLCGLLDWEAIEDRTRNVRKQPTWDNPQSIIEAVADQYQEDPWETQEVRPEVWIEKDALVGVIEGVCERYRVPYFACRGYTSQSEQYRAGKRFEHHRRRYGKRPVVLHLGDHDPSGLDMTRDNRDRLAMFASHDVEVRRLALNMDQVDQYGPPPNPAKETDARFSGYRDRYGDDSWELDALDPDVISDLIETELEGLIDHEAWEEAQRVEEANRQDLGWVAGNWSTVTDMIEKAAEG